MGRYENWSYYGFGIFMGYYNAILDSARDDLALWHGAVYAVAVVVIIWAIIWIFTGLPKKEGP